MVDDIFDRFMIKKILREKKPKPEGGGGNQRGSPSSATEPARRGERLRRDKREHDSSASRMRERGGCVDRPDPNSKRGSGSGKRFVPWCDDRKAG